MPWNQITNIRGPMGADGLLGLPAYTNTEEQFIVPAIGAIASIEVENASWIAVGQFVWLEGAGENGAAGALKAVAVSSNIVTLQNPDTSVGNVPRIIFVEVPPNEN